MKTFIGALIILAVITSITFGISLYTSKKTDYFIARIEEINTTDAENNLSHQKKEYETLLEKWEQASFAFNISNTRNDILKISEGFASVIGSCNANDQDNYIIEVKKLSNLFKDLKRNSEFNPDNIF